MKKLSIYLMLAVAGLFLAACGQEDNEFAGLKTANAEDAVVVPGFSAAELGVIDLNTVEVSDALDVQAFTVSEAALPDGVELAKGEIVFEDGTVIPTTASGQVSGKELSAYIASLYGRRPVERTVVGHVYLYAVQNGAAVKIDAGEVTFVVVPQAPVLVEAYYLTGTINGWDNGNTDFALSNGGQDPYENPTFTCKLDLEALGHPASVEFKVTPVDKINTGDWNSCLAAAEEEGKFNFNNEGGNFSISEIPADGKILVLTFNMLDQTWEYQVLSFAPYIYEIGNESGWSTAHPLFGANADGKYQGSYYLNGEFKFKPNENDWNGDWGQDPNGSYGTLVQEGEQNCWLPWDDVAQESLVGFYMIDVDLAAMTYQLTPIKSVYVVGSAVNNDWDHGVEMTYNMREGFWECYADFTEAGVIKFKGNGTWDTFDGNWGGTMDNIVNGSNDNIPVSVTGYVHIKFYPSCTGHSYCTISPLR